MCLLCEVPPTTYLFRGDVDGVLEHCPLHDLAAGGSGEGALVAEVPAHLPLGLEGDDGADVNQVIHVCFISYQTHQSCNTHLLLLTQVAPPRLFSAVCDLFWNFFNGSVPFDFSRNKAFRGRRAPLGNISGTLPRLKNRIVLMVRAGKSGFRVLWVSLLVFSGSLYLTKFS